MLVDGVDELLVVDISCSDHNQVVSEVVGRVEVSQMVYSQLMNIVSISLGWLSKHVFSVDIEVDIFEKSFLIPVMVVFMLLTDLFLDQFELVGIESAIADHISQNLDSLAHVVSEHLQPEGRDLSP